MRFVAVIASLMLGWNVIADSSNVLTELAETSSSPLAPLSKKCKDSIIRVKLLKLMHSGITEGRKRDLQGTLEKDSVDDKFGVRKYYDRVMLLNRRSFLVWSGMHISAHCDLEESERYLQYLNRR